MRRLFVSTATALLAVVVVAGSALASPAKPGPMSIVQRVLVNDGEFDILQAAVIEAGLANALDGRRQLTVFAPSDAAFVTTFRGLLGNPGLTESQVIDFIEAGGVDDALGAGTLAGILKYHVIPGRRVSASVLGAPSYPTLNGSRLTRGELVTAGIAAVDIPASNGVIHVISGVLMP
jgi:uncharacterized surface protein with fasciclin (FAS1) repeats